MTTKRWAGPMKRRSYFSQGIIACKMNKNIEECPFTESDENKAII